MVPLSKPYAFYFSPKQPMSNHPLTDIFEQTIRTALQNKVNLIFIPAEYILGVSEQAADSLTTLTTKIGKEVEINPSYRFSLHEESDTTHWLSHETERIVKTVSILHARKVFFEVNQPLPAFPQEIYDKLFRELRTRLPQIELINFPSRLTESYAATSNTPARTFYGRWYRLAHPEEPLRTFYETRSFGGVYLFRIPTDSNLVPFPQSMAQIRSFLNRLDKDAPTLGSSPIYRSYSWGHILTQGSNLKLVLDGVYPANGRIAFHLPGYRLTGGDGRMATYIQSKDSIIITIPHSAYSDTVPHLLTLNFDKPIRSIPHKIAKGLILSDKTAIPLYAQFRLPGDSLRPYIIGYKWEVGINHFNRLSLIYTQLEVNQSVHLSVDGKHYPVKLTDKFPNSTRANEGDEPFKTFRKAVKLNSISGANRHTIRIVSRNPDFNQLSRSDNRPSLSHIRIWINPIN